MNATCIKNVIDYPATSPISLPAATFCEPLNGKYGPKSRIYAKEDELKGQQEVEEVRKLLNEKTEYVKALEAQLAERPPKDDVIKKMKKYESVQKTHQNLIHELTMKLRQQNTSNGELISLVDNLKEELRELHYLKAQSDAELNREIIIRRDLADKLLAEESLNRLLNEKLRAQARDSSSREVELLNEIRQGKGVLENQEQKIHYQREEIVSLQVKVSQQATEITELYSKCNGVTLQDQSSPLLPDIEHCPDKICGEVQDPVMDMPVAKEETKRCHQKLGFNEILREDWEICMQFKKKQKDFRYKKSQEGRRMLPAWDHRDVILEAVRQHQVVVIHGETGCGKSTQIPQFILDDWLCSWDLSKSKHMEIICTQPRQLSAIGVAERVAEERAEKIGGTVGYQIHLKSRISSSTRLLFCTVGILLQRLASDPELSSVTHVLVDEVHERSEESDFLLLVLKELLLVNSDLKVILMSATVNTGLFSNYFEHVPVVEIPGRTFRVEQVFLEDVLESIHDGIEENPSSVQGRLKKRCNSDFDDTYSDHEFGSNQGSGKYIDPSTPDEDLSEVQLCDRYKDYKKSTCRSLYMMDPHILDYKLIEAIVLWILAGDHAYPKTGSILVFLPGMMEISNLYDRLMDNPVVSPRTGKSVLIPLHSSLTSEEQEKVFRRPDPGIRKIVLATNIAETSITIEDCVFVVDSGKMKENRFDSSMNMDSLDTVWVSQANALQRRGRAGRVMPGVCIHVFTRHRFEFVLMKQPVPELRRTSLEQVILRIKRLPHFSNRNPYDVLGGTLEPPAVESVTCALQRLRDVGALNTSDSLTPLGHHLAALPVDVRVGKLILFGTIFRCIDSALTIAACLTSKSVFLTPFGKKGEAAEQKKKFSCGSSDQLTALNAYKCWLEVHRRSRHAGRKFASDHFLSFSTLIAIGELKKQLLELLVRIGFICIAPGNIRFGPDNVIRITGAELNMNGDNARLLMGILSAAFYPNVVKVGSPQIQLTRTAAGALHEECICDTRKPQFNTRDNDEVNLHPSSVNCHATYFNNPYIVYKERVRTTRVFIRECSVVPLLPLVLFSGYSFNVEYHEGRFILDLEDGWITCKVDCYETAEVLQIMRSELTNLLEFKMENPRINLLTDEKSNQTIRSLIEMITGE